MEIFLRARSSPVVVMAVSGRYRWPAHGRRPDGEGMTMTPRRSGHGWPVDPRCELCRADSEQRAALRFRV